MSKAKKVADTGSNIMYVIIFIGLLALFIAKNT